MNNRVLSDLHPKLDYIFFVDADAPEKIHFSLKTGKYALAVHKDTYDESIRRCIDKIREQENALSRLE